MEECFDLYEKTLDRAQQPNLALGKKIKLNQLPKKYAEEDPQVLTDGAFGGSSYYANWLGFEGNDLDAILDLGTVQSVSGVSCAFLQVINHIVLFPDKVSFYFSIDERDFKLLSHLKNNYPLIRKSKVDDVQYFQFSFSPMSAR